MQTSSSDFFFIHISSDFQQPPRIQTCSTPQESRFRLAAAPKNPDIQESPKIPDLQRYPRIQTYGSPPRVQTYRSPPRIQTYSISQECKKAILRHPLRIPVPRESGRTAIPRSFCLQQNPRVQTGSTSSKNPDLQCDPRVPTCSTPQDSQIGLSPLRILV